jgi:hypothetical protein
MFYRPDEIERERSPRSIYFHGSIKTCIDRHTKATIVYNSIILFISCNLDIHDATYTCNAIKI